MNFGLPHWLKRTKDTSRALAKYEPPRANGSSQKFFVEPAAELTGAEKLGGWTAETLAAYQAESDARAMAVVAASMEGRFRPRPKWANSRYSPLHWRG